MRLNYRANGPIRWLYLLPVGRWLIVDVIVISRTPLLYTAVSLMQTVDFCRIILGSKSFNITSEMWHFRDYWPVIFLDQEHRSTVRFLLRPGRGCGVLWSTHLSVRLSVCVCLSVCLFVSISLEPLYRSLWNFVCRCPLAMAQCSSGGVAIRYVLPVLWMTSRLTVIDTMPKRGGHTTAMKRLPRAALWYRGRIWCLWMLVVCNLFADFVDLKRHFKSD